MTPQRPSDAPLVCTIGHSNRTIEVFLDLLRSNAVTRLLDVRTVPRSRHNPQFNRDTMPGALRGIGVSYEHMPGLGGLRRPRPDSANGGWRNLSFRGYADHMESDEFRRDVEHILELARTGRCVVMCAEAVPWRCHRSLIADALLVRGARVEDIIGSGHRSPHSMTAFARVDGIRITYPPLDEGGQLTLLA